MGSSRRFNALFSFLAAVALSDLKREPSLIAAPLGGKSGLGPAIVGGTLVAAVVSGVVAYRVSGPYG